MIPSCFPRPHRLLVAIVLLASAFSPSRANADVILNEILLEPSGPNVGQQFFELKGTPGEMLTDLSFVVFIGDPFGSGIVDQVLDLSPYSLGTNGLLLYRDDAATLDPAPDPGTTVISNLLPLPTFFANTSLTFALLRNFEPGPGDDLDFDDDGILDAAPWGVVEDAIGFRSNLPGLPPEGAFGTQLGFNDFPIVGFDPDALFRDGHTDEWYAVDVDNTSNVGPYPFEATQFVDIGLTPQAPANFTFDTLSPGTINAAAAVPEPSTKLIMLLVTMIGVIRLKGMR